MKEVGRDCQSSSREVRRRGPSLAAVRWSLVWSWDCTCDLDLLISVAPATTCSGKAAQGLVGVQMLSHPRGVLFLQMHRLSKVTMHRPCSVGQQRIFLINYKFVMADIPGRHPGPEMSVCTPHQSPRATCSPGTYRLP